jgi:hypothetical protein
MNHVGAQFFEDAIEIARGINQAAASMRLNLKVLLTQLFAKGAKRKNRVDARVMAVFALQPAELRD